MTGVYLNFINLNVQEDRLLIRLVDEYSVDGEDIDWSVLEQHFKGTRDSKQIRERWVNHLNPRSEYLKFFFYLFFFLLFYFMFVC